MGKSVYIAIPGSKDGQGGIVRQMTYFYDAVQTVDDAPNLELLPTRKDGNSFLSGFTFVKAASTLIIACLRKRISWLHLNVASKGSFYRKYILFRIARFFGVKTLVHLHGGGFQAFYAGSHPRVKRHIKRMFKQANQVIVLGSGSKDWCIKNFSLDESKVDVQFNATPKPETYRKKKNAEPHIVFLGHLLKRKGIDDLIDALKNSKINRLPWKVTLAGSGDIGRYKELCSQKNIRDRVNFTGWLDEDEVEALYKSADILVLPSHVENQPLCLIEAMAHGLGIISTDVGTIPDMTIHDSDALLFTPRDIKTLTKHLTTLLTDEKKRKSLGQNAKKTYNKQFELTKYAASLLKYYN